MVARVIILLAVVTTISGCVRPSDNLFFSSDNLNTERNIMPSKKELDAAKQEFWKHGFFAKGETERLYLDSDEFHNTVKSMLIAAEEVREEEASG